MKLNKLFFFLLIAAFAIFIVGCEKDEDEINEFNVLTSYIEDNDLDWINDMAGWVVSLGAINTADYLVLDIRAADHYNAEHIAGAVNATMGNMFDVVAKANAEKVLVVCYSGQSSSFAHMLLRLKGIEAYSLKFGMSSFSQDHDKWTAKCSDKNAGDLVKTPSPALPTFDFPELNTGEETGEAILDERIEAAIAAWPTLTSADNVIDNADNYNIMNYWAEADYLKYGHIDGAYQLPLKTLTTDGNLNAFDPAGENIFYCWTGQTAASACAYLTVLGYDVKSIAYGFNNMNWSALEGHKWSKPYGG